MSKVTLTFTERKVDVAVEEIVINSKFEEDPELKTVVKKYQGVFILLFISVMNVK